VPSLHGLTLAAAASRLAKAHCLLGAVTRRVARKAFVGKVLSQQPAAGGRMADGARVAVVVGRRR
jgi:beta-lactam-binding protein with PASTA domain